MEDRKINNKYDDMNMRDRLYAFKKRIADTQGPSPAGQEKT